MPPDVWLKDTRGLLIQCCSLFPQCRAEVLAPFVFLKVIQRLRGVGWMREVPPPKKTICKSVLFPSVLHIISQCTIQYLYVWFLRTNSFGEETETETEQLMASPQAYTYTIHLLHPNWGFPCSGF